MRVGGTEAFLCGGLPETVMTSLRVSPWIKAAGE